MKLGFILNITASILKWILQPFCFIYGTIESLCKREFNLWQSELSIAKDCWGNVMIKYPGNRWLIQSTGHKFGNRKETISKVLGINKNNGTLRKPGIILCKILNWFEPNHVEKAAIK